MTLPVLLLLGAAVEAPNTSNGGILVTLAVISSLTAIVGPILMLAFQRLLGGRVRDLEREQTVTNTTAQIAKERADRVDDRSHELAEKQGEARALATTLLVQTQAQLAQTEAFYRKAQAELEACVAHREEGDRVRGELEVKYRSLQRQQARTEQRLHVTLATLQEALPHVNLSGIEVEDEVDPIEEVQP